MRANAVAPWRLAAAVCAVALIGSGCNAGGPPEDVSGPMVVTPVVAYLVAQNEFALQGALEGPILFLDFWDSSAYEMFGGQDGEVSPGSAALSEATPLNFGSLDDVTRAAIAGALSPLGPPEYVSSADEAQDRDGPEHLGCFPFRGDGTLITLGVPLQPFVPASEQNARLIVSAAISHGCGGTTWLLELTWDGEAYAAERIDGFNWAV